MLKDVKNVGKKDQIVDVSDGYGANYLIPKKLAARADNSAINQARTKEDARVHKIETDKAAAKELSEKLAASTVKIKASSGADQRLYGSITTKDIADAMEAQLGITVDKRKISLDEPIKAYGTYNVEIKLYSEISGTLKVVVCD